MIDKKGFTDDINDDPKDLGLKIGSKEEVEWTKIKENQESTIRASKINIAVSEIVLELAKKKIAEEKEKFK